MLPVDPASPAGPAAASAHLLLRHRRAFYGAHSAAPPVNISTTHRALETIDDSILVCCPLLLQFLIFPPADHHINIDTLTHAKPDSWPCSDIWRKRCSFQLLFPQPARFFQICVNDAAVIILSQGADPHSTLRPTDVCLSRRDQVVPPKKTGRTTGPHPHIQS